MSGNDVEATRTTGAAGEDVDEWERAAAEALEYVPTVALIWWSVAETPVAVAVVVTLASIDQYWRAAHRQMERIQRPRVDDFAPPVGALGERNPAPQLITEIHFYWTCWCMIDLDVAFLAKTGQFDAFAAAYDRHKNTLQKYRRARNHLEHHEERLPGQREAGKAMTEEGGSPRYSFGNVQNWAFQVGDDDPVDVGPTSLQALDDIVADLFSSVRREAMAIEIARRRERSPERGRTTSGDSDI